MEPGYIVRTRRLQTVILAAALLLALAAAAPPATARTAPLIVDHTSANLTPIPAPAIANAQSNLHIAYGHTSHGSQLTGGMAGLLSFDGAPLPPATYAFNEGGTGGDLGNPDFSSWASRTRAYLGLPGNSDVNVVMWSWCGQVSWASEAEIVTDLSLMDGLERDYPSVTFVYMTGHLDGTGPTGNLHLRNEQIRAWCRSGNRVLYDFADIESYGPDGAGYLADGADDGCNYGSGENWAREWQASHTEGMDWYSCSAAHTEPLNANLKAYAAWHLFARLAGWDPEPALRQLPGGAGLPTDRDGDGLYDDVNGNGRPDFADVVLFFDQMSWIGANTPVSAFDCNGNGRIDFADVVWLFDRL